MHQKKWRPGTGRRKNRYNKSTCIVAHKPDIPQRIINLKVSMPPIRYYLDELPGFTPRTDSGWVLTNALCPFHQDKRPGSFSVNLTSGGYRCFSCGAAGGDILAFHGLRYALGFMDVLADLEGRAGL